MLARIRIFFFLFVVAFKVLGTFGRNVELQREKDVLFTVEQGNI